jgi:hypothetical protein
VERFRVEVSSLVGNLPGGEGSRSTERDPALREGANHTDEASTVSWKSSGAAEATVSQPLGAEEVTAVRVRVESQSTVPDEIGRYKVVGRA